jgi:anthranilate/para-aminobenzoate synthase component II
MPRPARRSRCILLQRCCPAAAAAARPDSRPPRPEQTRAFSCCTCSCCPHNPAAPCSSTGARPARTPADRVRAPMPGMPDCFAGHGCMLFIAPPPALPAGARRLHTSRSQVTARATKGPVVVIDNYDSFTYNLCQVRWAPRSRLHGLQSRARSPAPRQGADPPSAAGSPPVLQYLGDLGVDYVVYKNDEKTVAEIRAMNPAGILVSPGPGAAHAALACGSAMRARGAQAARPRGQPERPACSASPASVTWLPPCQACSSAAATRAAGRPVDSGISLQAVSELGPEFPLFGVCMGHQCIGEAFGGKSSGSSGGRSPWQGSRAQLRGACSLGLCTRCRPARTWSSPQAGRGRGSGSGGAAALHSR